MKTVVELKRCLQPMDLMVGLVDLCYLLKKRAQALSAKKLVSSLSLGLMISVKKQRWVDLKLNQTTLSPFLARIQLQPPLYPVVVVVAKLNWERFVG